MSFTATTHFKLTEPKGITRRINFPNRPTWLVLAAKIQSLYGIPIEQVSVAYLDSDNDQITLSSQEELEDFYQASHRPDQVIKFTVQDLSSIRVKKPESPPNANRNTFGIPVGAFDIEDDWQSLPPFSGLGNLFIPGATSSHAFVEVVDSDASTVTNNQGARSTAHSTTHSSPSSPFIISLDKGKERATDDDGDISSTGSVLAENVPEKHPVHVYDIGTQEKDDTERFEELFPSLNNMPQHPVEPIAAESTPKTNSQGLTPPEPNATSAESAASSPFEDATDPPLPSIEKDVLTNTSPSLSNDVAALLNTLNNVFAAHPELSEGIRNIVRSASSGTYWNAHREAISQAAQNIAQASVNAGEQVRSAEEEAGQRIADAIGGIFRSLSQMLGAVNAESTQPSSMPGQEETSGQETAPPSHANGNQRGPSNASPWWFGPGPGRRSSHPWRGPEHPTHPHAPYFNPWMHRGASLGQHWAPRGPPPPPSNPPPHGPSGHNGEPLSAGPLPPAPPPPPPLPSGPWNTPPWVWGPAPPPPPPPPSAPPVNATADSKPTPQELRAQVDEAKARYKAEKERYRQEREERRKERERKAQTMGPEM